ncbi:OLC1v1021212C1 [Oldenlandia corymbosa var. corymbosa]|uniref:OLC1v1021212C1 n=1 Tax=Oldenlandia corymbosa var. corymbosa TaxID=529605 RepID=A0AAV1BWC3_OLDCO|nr:OLC1v1021212C1 [Oldenlandia corymbosa var. corymbosa]
MSNPDNNIAPMSYDNVNDDNNNHNPADPMSDDSENSSFSVTSRPPSAGSEPAQNGFRLPPPPAPETFKIMRDLHHYSVLSRMRKAVEWRRDRLARGPPEALQSTSYPGGGMDDDIRDIEAVMEGQRDLEALRAELLNADKIWLSCLEECNAVVELYRECGWTPDITIFASGSTEVQAMVHALEPVPSRFLGFIC